MPKIKLKQVDEISRKTVSYAFTAFMRHCKLKNLSPYSYLYYDKNIKFFFEMNPEIKYRQTELTRYFFLSGQVKELKNILLA